MTALRHSKDLSKTPRVTPATLQRALLKIREAAPGVQAALDGYVAEFGQGRASLATIARARALLKYQALAETRESDARLAGWLEHAARVGLEGAPVEALHREAEARLMAASRHPLDAAGWFAPGFREAINTARAELAAADTAPSA